MSRFYNPFPGSQIYGNRNRTGLGQEYYMEDYLSEWITDSGKVLKSVLSRSFLL